MAIEGDGKAAGLEHENVAGAVPTAKTSSFSSPNFRRASSTHSAF